MLSTGVSIPPFKNFQHSSQPASPENAKKIDRGERAVTELMNRKGFIDRVDNFLGNKSHRPAEDHAYFVAKIRNNQHLLSQQPIRQDCKRFAHRIFDIYRREMVEKACQSVDINPQALTFSAEEWKLKNFAFKDFVWTYVKSTWSSEANLAITEAMKTEFPSLPKDFWPAVYSVINPSENDYFYPND